MSEDPAWQLKLQKQFARMPLTTKRVAVAYFDHQSCNAPSINEVVMACRKTDCHTILLDTFGKSQGNLFEYVSETDLKSLLGMIRREGMISVVAGSVDFECLESVVRCHPDIVGVRGAVCTQDRITEIDQNKTVELVKRLRTLSATCQPLISSSY